MAVGGHPAGPGIAHDLSTDPHADVRAGRLAHAALASYRLPGAGADVAVEPVTISENATFRVGGPWPAPTWILRVHRLGYHSPAQVASELAWLEAVRAEAGVRTPAVVPAMNGERVVEVEDPDGGPARMVVLFEFLPGEEPEPDDLVGNAADLGRLTARLHAHARAWRRPPWFDRFTWDLDAAFGPAPRWGHWRDGVGVGPAEHRLLRRAQDTVAERLEAYGRGPQRFGLVHADLRAANLLACEQDGVRRTSVIDFDDCGFSWYLYDLAAAVSFVEDRPDLPEVVEAWVRGYRAVAHLTPEDVAVVDTLVMLRRLLLLGWIGTHQGSPAARDLAPGFAAGSCQVAQRYLSGRLCHDGAHELRG